MADGFQILCQSAGDFSKRFVLQTALAVQVHDDVLVRMEGVDPVDGAGLQAGVKAGDHLPGGWGGNLGNRSQKPHHRSGKAGICRKGQFQLPDQALNRVFLPVFCLSQLQGQLGQLMLLMAEGNDAAFQAGLPVFRRFL